MRDLLHINVDEKAMAAPDAPAFRFTGETLSYAGLAQKSDAVAGTLIEHGVKRGDRVGLYLNKSLATAISLYGVMKAGAAYVPLDPSSPAERTRAVMQQCSVSAFITHKPRARAAADVLRSYQGRPLACVIGMPEGDGKAPALSWDDAFTATRKATQNILPGDLAYIIFTSGSTGAPKGIMHSHSSGLAYARAAASLYEVTSASRLSNHSPLHFDMSTFDYFCSPLAGACTVIIPEPHAKMPASLSQLIEDEKLTHWYSVPFALIQLLERGALEKRDLSSLRWIMYGGEPFPAKHISALMDMLPNARISNVYGPAEVNQCTYHHVTRADIAAGEPPPIGRVWDDAEGIVLRDDDTPVAAGEPGELMIRSASMMRGYWERPDLNARAYYRRPVTSDIDDVFYRTGDLVTQDENGVIRFLGRKDRQIKLRGFRIELEEVEAVISEQPGVIEAAAIVLPDETGESAIVGAVRAKPGSDDAAIRAGAAQCLPVYAAPARIIILEDFDRTTSGKIDRRALKERLSETRSLETV